MNLNFKQLTIEIHCRLWGGKEYDKKCLREITLTTFGSRLAEKGREWLVLRKQLQLTFIKIWVL